MCLQHDRELNIKLNSFLQFQMLAYLLQIGTKMIPILHIRAIFQKEVNEPRNSGNGLQVISFMFCMSMAQILYSTELKPQRIILSYKTPMIYWIRVVICMTSHFMLTSDKQRGQIVNVLWLLTLQSKKNVIEKWSMTSTETIKSQMVPNTYKCIGCQ